MTGQDFAVFAIVGAATLYLVRHLWQMGTSKSGCGGCKSCPSSQTEKEPELVQIDLGASWKR